MCCVVVVEIKTRYSKKKWVENSVSIFFNHSILKKLCICDSAEFTCAELEKLLEMAESFTNGVLRYPPYDEVLWPCEVFYRNNTVKYFDNCYAKHNGTMNVYLKGNSGDPACIINGQISGLFFMASVNFTDGLHSKIHLLDQNG